MYCVHNTGIMHYYAVLNCIELLRAVQFYLYIIIMQRKNTPCCCITKLAFILYSGARHYIIHYTRILSALPVSGTLISFYLGFIQPPPCAFPQLAVLIVNRA
jgi:hypothetical protein